MLLKAKPCISRISYDIHENTSTCYSYSSPARKLVNESHQIFVKLQQETGGNRSPSAISSSRDYRAVIKACVMELRNMVSTCHDENQKETLDAQLKLFDMVELIWSLCEILFIESLPGPNRLLIVFASMIETKLLPEHY